MNNYYTLIYLNREINRNISGGKFQFSISPHKNVLECYVTTADKKWRLVFSCEAGETALFLDDYRPPKKRNVVSFFDSLEGRKITRTLLAEYDRLLTIHFKGDRHLVFKLFGNHANALLVENGLIIEAFKNPDELKDQPAPEPQTPDFSQTVTAAAKPKNQLTRINPLLPRNLLPALIDQHEVGEMSVEAVKTFSEQITDALINDPHPRVLATGDVCLWSEELLDVPTQQAFETVNNCVRFAYRHAVHLRRLHQKKERLGQFLDQSHRQKKAQLHQLRQADKSLERADRYEQFGHLLMAHAHESLETGQESIEVKNFYQGEEPVTIPVKADLSIAENAERYYDKAQSSRSSYQNAKKRLPKVKKEMEKADELLDRLQAFDRLYELEKWIKQKQETLKKFGYGTEDEGQAVSPFRKFKVGNYEIWIGKNAKSNDTLTRRAHKEDIWLHARGVSGSHAVIRMGNESSYPPQKVLLHAAAYAAYYSKAKGTKSAPVMYTKRKYVYKPSGADPGAVVAKREEVVMVPPTKPN